MRTSTKKQDPKTPQTVPISPEVASVYSIWRLRLGPSFRFVDYAWGCSACNTALPCVRVRRLSCCEDNANEPRAGMAFEDGAVLGECLSRLPSDPSIDKTSPAFLEAKRHALAVFEKCRKQRTKMVVERGNVQQYLYHLDDGPEQEERDRKMRMVPTPEGEALAWRDPGLAPKLLGYDHIADVSSHWTTKM